MRIRHARPCAGHLRFVLRWMKNVRFDKTRSYEQLKLR
jgi:hypothetical protein